MELNRSCKPPRCLNLTAWNDETTRLLLSMWKILSATLSCFSSCLGGFGPNVFCCQERTRVKSENINSSQWRHMTWTYFMEDISDHFCHLPLAWPPHKPHLTIPSCWPQAIQQSSPRVGLPSPLCALEMASPQEKIGTFCKSQGWWVHFTTSILMCLSS